MLRGFTLRPLADGRGKPLISDVAVTWRKDLVMAATISGCLRINRSTFGPVPPTPDRLFGAGGVFIERRDPHQWMHEESLTVAAHDHEAQRLAICGAQQRCRS